MKFAIPEISWHNRDPVLSIDFQPKCGTDEPLRLASGGTDSHVLIWYISTTDSGSVNLEVAADLTRHQKAVNVVRWSPNGQYLASGDDESIIFIWKQKTDKELASAPLEQGEEQYKESWVIHKTLRGHMEDVLDISWSADSLRLASGSVDNKLLLWDVGRGKYSCILADHKGFVQGVSWDPRGQLVASASTDRVFRTFDIATKKVTSRSSKSVLPFPSDHPLHEATVRLYHDDTLQTYYRRLQFSPDGLFIAVPAGRIEPEGKLDTKPINAVYIYTRYSLKVPACVLPCGEPALVVRWAPLLYAARAGPPALGGGPRMVLAVATRRCVLLYDTHQRAPLAVISNIHYTRLTDLSWSADGRTLAAASTDGFCSVVMFAPRELGDALPDPAPAPPQPAPGPMEVQEQPSEAKEKPEDPTPSKTSSMKFKAPVKSLKRQKTEAQPKTPVKMDVLMETAMPSWSDNSSSSFKQNESKPKVDEEIMIIEDSEDIKLVYEDTCKSQSPNEEQPSTKSQDESPKRSEQVKTSPKPSEKSSQTRSPFMKQAKVTDVREPAVKAAPSPRAPRRVNFVTLSSPKNKKKC